MKPRTLAATAAGYAIAVAITIAGAELARVLFPFRDGRPTTGFLSIAIAACFLGSIAGAYAAARLAPLGRHFAAVMLFVLAIAVTAMALARLAPTFIQPLVVLPLTALLSVIGAFAGAMIERAVYGGRIGSQGRPGY